MFLCGYKTLRRAILISLFSSILARFGPFPSPVSVSLLQETPSPSSPSPSSLSRSSPSSSSLLNYHHPHRLQSASFSFPLRALLSLCLCIVANAGVVAVLLLSFPSNVGHHQQLLFSVDHHRPCSPSSLGLHRLCCVYRLLRL